MPNSLFCPATSSESPNGNFKFYLPITTSIVVSLVLSLLLRFFG